MQPKSPPQVVELALPGCQLTKFEVTPMTDAAIRGLVDVIQILVDYGTQINALNVVS